MWVYICSYNVLSPTVMLHCKTLYPYTPLFLSSLFGCEIFSLESGLPVLSPAWFDGVVLEFVFLSTWISWMFMMMQLLQLVRIIGNSVIVCSMIFLTWFLLDLILFIYVPFRGWRLMTCLASLLFVPWEGRFWFDCSRILWCFGCYVAIHKKALLNILPFYNGCGSPSSLDHFLICA